MSELKIRILHVEDSADDQLILKRSLKENLPINLDLVALDTGTKGITKLEKECARGTFQTIIKHRNVFGNPRFGYLCNLTFQYVILSVVFVPFVSVVSLIVIALAVLIGYAMQVLLVMAVFMLIQATYSVLEIMMDDEDWKLAVYSPLFVVGFKEVRNFLKIKSLFDILSRREMTWGTLQRIGTSETKSTAEPANSK